MPLPSSGPLSMSAINTEFGRGLNLNAYRGTSWFTAAGGSGTFTSTNLGFDQFYGKQLASPTFSFAISASQANANLRSLAVAAGWNQSSAVVATVNGGVYIYSTSTGTPGLTINGSFPGGVTLVNNGLIMGMGGQGGQGGTISGAAGGNAISLGVSVTITNNSYIAGGGGGGGSAPDYTNNSTSAGGGGGAGGGTGGRGGYNTIAGGAGGGLGASGSNGGQANIAVGKSVVTCGSGGGGGRILPGTGGAGGSGGSRGGFGGGAGGGGAGANGFVGAAGYAGGSANNAGTSTPYTGSQAFWVAAGGGGWGASGGSNIYSGGTPPQPGGAGGKAVALNGYSATFTVVGTRYGAVS